MSSNLNNIFKPKSIKEFEEKCFDEEELLRFLIKSIELNFVEGVKLAINRGVDINIKESYPLKYALSKNNEQIIKLLKDNGVDTTNISTYTHVYDNDVNKIFFVKENFFRTVEEGVFILDEYFKKGFTPRSSYGLAENEVINLFDSMKNQLTYMLERYEYCGIAINEDDKTLYFIV